MLDVTAAERPSRLHSFFRKVDKRYQKFWRRRNSHALIGFLFVAEIVVLIGGVTYTIYNNIDDIQSIFDGTLTYGQEVLFGQVLASIVAGGLVLYGLTLLGKSRGEAFEQFRRATLVNIYLNRVLYFYTDPV